MSVNLLSYTKAAYIGALSAQAIQVTHGVGRSIPLQFDWISYGSNANQNIYVPINLAGPQNRQLLQNIRSVYIDNLGNAATIYVQFADTLQTISAQPYSSGWYPAFTNSWDVTIAAAGLNSNAPASTRVFVTDIIVPPYTDIGNQQVTGLELASPSIGGGSSIVSVVSVVSGSGYVNGNLTVSGGGGVGAILQGTVDGLGRFTNIKVLNGGSGYTGSPVITPTAPHGYAEFNPGGTYIVGQLFSYNGNIWYFNGGSNNTIVVGAAAWNNATVYPAGSQVNYAANIYFTPVGVGGGPPPPTEPSLWTLIGPATPVNGAYWTDTGVVNAVNAQFAVVLSAPANAIATAGFGARALGDQALTVEASINGAGVFVNNIFGTPYQSGFIYLTSVRWASLLVADAASVYTLETNDGFIQLSAISRVGPFEILKLDNCNIKLDATKTWRMNCTTFGIASQLNFQYAWTYNQQ